MVNRIKKVIGLKNFSLSHFADHIGVQRATISHILSGRNKPSLEVIQKILDAFPEISAEWLVKGKGNITNSSPTLFSDFENNEQLPPYTEKKAHVESVIHDAQTTISKNEETVGEKEKMIGEEEETVEEKEETVGEKEEMVREKTAANMPGDAKKSIRIIIMYADGTYSEHLPMTEK